MKIIPILKRPTNSIPLSYEKFLSNPLNFKYRDSNLGSICQKYPIKSIFGDLNKSSFKGKQESTNHPFGPLPSKQSGNISFNLNNLRSKSDDSVSYDHKSTPEVTPNSVLKDKSINKEIQSNRNELSPFNYVTKIYDSKVNDDTTWIESDSIDQNDENRHFSDKDDHLNKSDGNKGNNRSVKGSTNDNQFRSKYSKCARNNVNHNSEIIANIDKHNDYIEEKNGDKSIREAGNVLGIRSLEGSDVFEGRYAHLKEYRNENVESIVCKGINVLERINSLIKERALRGLTRECIEILSEIKKRNIQASTETYNNCILGCAKAKNAKLARYLFLCMRSELLTPDLRTYTLMIKTHINSGDVPSAFSIYRKMEKEGTKGDLVVFSALIDCLVESKQISNAWRLFNYMRTWRLIEPDEVLFTIMIKSCGISREAEKALNLYQEMTSMNLYPTIHTYTELIRCLCKRKEFFNDCFQFYNKIKSQEYPINTEILTNLLESCCTVGNVRRAREVLSEASAMGVKPTLEMYNVYIKTFANHIKFNKLSENEKINHIHKTWEIVRRVLSDYLTTTPNDGVGTDNEHTGGTTISPHGEGTNQGNSGDKKGITRLLNSVILVYESGCYYDFALEVLNCFPRFNASPDYMTYYILLRMVGPGMKDVGKFFALWNEAKSHIAPQKTLLYMALDMAILSRSAKKTLEILNDMYSAKVFPTPSLMKKLYESGKKITQIHMMINNLVTLQRKITYQEKINESKMLQTYIDENELNKSVTTFKSM